MGRNKHIDLFKDMIPAVDLGIKELWDASTDEGKKEIAGDLYNLNRYISSVKTNNRVVQEHYVLTVNEFYNKHWHILQKHPKLLWLLLCLCKLDGNTYYHEWIGNKKKTDNSDKKIKFLSELYPTKKLDDIEVLSKLLNDNDMKNLANDMGLSNNDIKKLF